MKNKKLLLIFFVLPLILYNVNAIEECKGTITQDESPCTILLPKIDNVVGQCNNEYVTFFFNSSTLLYDQQMGDYAPFLCNATFNSSIIGTHTFNYSTGDSGSIIVEKEDNMLSIILLQLFLIAFFIIIGIPHKAGFVKFFSWGLGLLELIMTVWMVYIVEIVGDITQLLYINTMIVLIVGGFLGVYSLIVVQFKLASVDKKNQLKEDGYTKWAFGNK